MDISKIITKTAFNRENQINVSDLMQLSCLKNPIVSDEFFNLVNCIKEARRNEKPVILFMGAHVIKCRLSLYVNDLIKKGWVTHVAGNGAVSIHDFELAFLGATSEDVPKSIEDGSFGMWEETGAWMNEAIKNEANKGYGSALAYYIDLNQEKFPHKDCSILYTAYINEVPISIHVTIGADIIHQHPKADFGAIGTSSGVDFYKICNSVSGLDGGVFLNFGSAITGPEIFLKALSISRNLGYARKNLTTANFDIKPLGDYKSDINTTDPNYYYRPRKNIVNRPTQGTGKGFNFELNHKESIPMLHTLLSQECDS